jgi:hypothetical protein
MNSNLNGCAGLVLPIAFNCSRHEAAVPSAELCLTIRNLCTVISGRHFMHSHFCPSFLHRHFYTVKW